jgi:hypothetical protein
MRVVWYMNTSTVPPCVVHIRPRRQILYDQSRRIELSLISSLSSYVRTFLWFAYVFVSSSKHKATKSSMIKRSSQKVVVRNKTGILNAGVWVCDGCYGQKLGKK